MPPFPESWFQWIGNEFEKPYWKSLNEFVMVERQTGNVFPDESEVFRAFELTPPQSIKVVLLGQDPYPTPGNAHGLSFSVKPGVAIPASLRNIFKELKSDLDIPISTTGDLTPWAQQGVLLLNTVLTVRSGKAGSHRGKGWETFTDAVIKAISHHDQHTVFLLWGKDAHTKRTMIDDSRHAVFESAHPSPFSAHRGFFGSKPFSKTNAKLIEFGKTPIDWSLA